MHITESLKHEFDQIECVHGLKTRKVCEQRVADLPEDEVVDVPQMAWKVCQEVNEHIFSAPDHPSNSEMHYE